MAGIDDLKIAEVRSFHGGNMGSAWAVTTFATNAGRHLADGQTAIPNRRCRVAIKALPQGGLGNGGAHRLFQVMRWLGGVPHGDVECLGFRVVAYLAFEIMPAILKN